jgi:REP element-mobilizing transposase RayT
MRPFTMPQSLSNVLIHIVFPTKERRLLLQDTAKRDAMHRYLAGISVRLDCPIMRVGGTEDHVHLLGRQARTITLADWVKELKRASSLWAKGQELAAFQWQAGYGGFSVSQSQFAEVERYLARQPEHHRKFDFQQEFRKLLKLHGVEWDERYVWD